MAIGFALGTLFVELAMLTHTSVGSSSDVRTEAISGELPTSKGKAAADVAIHSNRSITRPQMGQYKVFLKTDHLTITPGKKETINQLLHYIESKYIYGDLIMNVALKYRL